MSKHDGRMFNGVVTFGVVLMFSVIVRIIQKGILGEELGIQIGYFKTYGLTILTVALTLLTMYVLGCLVTDGREAVREWREQ